MRFDGGKYFSVGRTSLLEGSGVKASYEELGRDGCRLVTKGDTVLMIGGKDKGTINAVYDFLQYTFDYECYAIDEIKIEKRNTAKLLAFDLTDIPSFTERSTAYHVHNNATFALRMRAQNKLDGWAKWSHSEFNWISPDTYYDQHHDWYSSDKLQLCITRAVGDLMSDEYDHSNMRGTYVEGVKKYLINNPAATHMHLGIVDNRSYCKCESCRASDAKYGGQAGSRIRFTMPSFASFRLGLKKIIRKERLCSVALPISARLILPLSMIRRRANTLPPIRRLFRATISRCYGRRWTRVMLILSMRNAIL